MKKSSGAGYTITELLIVLAITSVLAMSALSMIRVQQGKNEFHQSVRDFETKILDIANDVAKGFFPNRGVYPWVCAPSSTGIQFTAGSKEQGSSEECVFAGKVIQFNPDGDDTRMQIYTLASRRRAADGKEIVDLSQLALRDIRLAPDLDENLALIYGLRVRAVDGNGNNVGALAFVSGFASQTASGSFTGAPETDVRWLAGSALNQNRATLSGLVDNPNNYRPAAPATPNIAICLFQGTGGRTARITLGRDGRLLTTSTEFDVVC